MGSEVEEKRQLIKLLLSNLRVEGDKVVDDVLKPFNLIVNGADDISWHPLRDYFITNSMTIEAAELRRYLGIKNTPQSYIEYPMPYMFT